MRTRVCEKRESGKQPFANLRLTENGQKMQLAGRENANNIRDATCADKQTSIE